LRACVENCGFCPSGDVLQGVIRQGIKKNFAFWDFWRALYAEFVELGGQVVNSGTRLRVSMGFLWKVGVYDGQMLGRAAARGNWRNGRAFEDLYRKKGYFG
jgi:hypothetical protein